MKIGEQITCPSEFLQWRPKPLPTRLCVITFNFNSDPFSPYSRTLLFYSGHLNILLRMPSSYISFLLDPLVNNFQIFVHLILQKDNFLHCLAIFSSWPSCCFFCLLAVKCAESFQFHWMPPYSV